MKYVAMLGLVAAASLYGASAMAGTYVVEESQSRYISCYNKVYVPAKILVNTRGKLVKAGGHAWDISGDRWDYVREIPVFIETRRVSEPDHYTLVSTGCP